MSHEDILKAGEQHVLPELRTAVGNLSAQLRPMAEYHFGWTDADGRPTKAISSKFLRPAMVVSLGRALGVLGPSTARAGAALQLMHAFAFVHDDLIDRDEHRWGRKTIWAVFGEGQAINLGDALIVLAQQVLLDIDESGSRQALTLLLSTMEGILEGQSIDVAFERQAAKGVADWEHEAILKSGVSYAAGAAMVPVLFEHPGSLVDQLMQYGKELGLSLQACDDVLGIWGDVEKNSGRIEGSDLRSGKITLPVIFATCDHESEELREHLASINIMSDHAEIEHARKLLDMNGGLEQAIQFAKLHASTLFALIEELEVDSRCREEMLAIARRCLPADLSDWPDSLAV